MCLTLKCSSLLLAIYQPIQEISAGAKQRAAQRAVDKGDPYAEEQKRLAEEKKKQEAEAAKKREESRQRLAEKAKLFK